MKFLFNGVELKRADFTTEEASIRQAVYTDVSGNEHDVKFLYYSLKLKEPRIRLFLQCFDGSIF